MNDGEKKFLNAVVKFIQVCFIVWITKWRLMLYSKPLAVVYFIKVDDILVFLHSMCLCAYARSRACVRPCVCVFVGMWTWCQNVLRRCVYTGRYRHFKHLNRKGPGKPARMFFYWSEDQTYGKYI